MKEITGVQMLEERYDVVVVGAGPAGLAAATMSAELGASTLVLDENAGPGGQIYRAVTSTPVTTRATLGEDYWRGAELAGAFEASDSSYARGATVWSVGPVGLLVTRYRRDGSRFLLAGTVTSATLELAAADLLGPS